MSEESSEEEIYEVAAIVGHKDSKKQGRKYEIKWKGYEETTFEPYQNLVPNSVKLVERYNKKHPVKRSKYSKRKRDNKKVKRESNPKRVTKPEDLGEETDSDIGNENYRKIPKKTERKLFHSKQVRLPKKSHGSRKRLKAKSSKKRKAKKVVKRKSRSVTKKSNSDEYEVELLLKHRDTLNGREYLVKWKGYPKSEATYEPSSNLWCRSLVRQYDHLRGKWRDPLKRKRDAQRNADPSSGVRRDSHDEKEEERKKPVRLSRGDDGKWRKDSSCAPTSDDPSAKEEEERVTEEDEKQRESPSKHKKEKKRGNVKDKADNVHKKDNGEKEKQKRKSGEKEKEKGEGDLKTKPKRKKSRVGVDKTGDKSS